MAGTDEATADLDPETGATEGVGSGGEAPQGEAEATEQPSPEAPTGSADGDEGVNGEGAPDAPADGATTEPESEKVWPDDWREKLAGEDEQLLRELRRYKNPENVAKALREAKTALRNRETVSFDLPEDATEEQKAAHRKRLGIPESADDYKIEPPREDMAKADKQLFDEFRGLFYERNVPPSIAQSMVDAYFDKQAAYEQAIAEHAQQKHDEWRVELKQEFGAEYDKNIRVADTFIGQALGERGQEIVNLTLNDGTKLGNHPDFVRLMTEAGMKSLDDDLLVTAGDSYAGKDIDAEIKSALEVQLSDPRTYYSADHQAKLAKLYEAKERRDARNRR